MKKLTLIFLLICSMMLKGKEVTPSEIVKATDEVIEVLKSKGFYIGASLHYCSVDEISEDLKIKNKNQFKKLVYSKGK